MRKLIATLAAAFWASAAMAAPVELPVNLKEGATWEIQTIRVRTRDEDGKVTETRMESRSQASLGLDGEMLVLSLAPLPGYASADLPPEMTNFGLDFPLEFEVDEALTPSRLRNWPKLRDAVLKFFASQPGGDPAFVKTVLATYDRLSDETAAALFAPHLAYLGTGQGLALEVGKSVDYEDEIGNPIGGPPIATHGSFVLETHDRRAKRAVVLWSQAMDPKSMEANIREASKAITGPRPNAPDDGQMKIDRKERCRFDIHTPTGLATSSECSMSTTVSAPGRRLNQTDAWTIVQTLPKSR